ncbi:MAG: hypothetical protein ABI742_04620 [Gemmatimonadota bacterium]
MRTQKNVAAAVAITLLAVACSDAGGPGGTGQNFDAADINTNLQTVQQVLGGGAWQSLRTLGPRFGAAGPAAALAGKVGAGLVTAQSGLSPVMGGVRIAQALLSSSNAHLVAPQLPPAIRGTTFVLDGTTLQYVPDSTRIGAPANGVRFILYAVDSATQQPLPSQELGQADLTDEGDPLAPGIALRLTIVMDRVTRLDYSVAVLGAANAGTLQATGFTTDGTTRVEFRVGVVGAHSQDTTVAEVQFAIGVPSKGFLATATLQHVSLTGDSAGAIQVQVWQGLSQVGMAGHATSAEVQAVFQVNGIPFATIEGDPNHPIVRSVDGRDLTVAEVEALVGIHLVVGRVGEMFDCLMQPVGGILGAGAAS